VHLTRWARGRSRPPRRADRDPLPGGDRVGAGGELVELTDDDIKLWMFWLGLDYVLHR
jgi:hypothetical protein